MTALNFGNEGLDRYTSRPVTFTRPFTLGTAPEIYPPGTYVVESKELPLEAGGRTAYVRVSTVLVIRTAAKTISREVQPSEVDEALLKDIEPSEAPDQGNADGPKPDTRPRRAGREERSKL